MPNVPSVIAAALVRNAVLLTYGTALLFTVAATGCKQTRPSGPLASSPARATKQAAPQTPVAAPASVAYEACRFCNATGWHGGFAQKCTCVEAAEVQRMIRLSTAPHGADPNCPICRGTGNIICFACNGATRVPAIQAAAAAPGVTAGLPFANPTRPCYRCAGTGAVRCDWSDCIGGRAIHLSSGGDEAPPCPKCGGSGYITCVSCGSLLAVLGNYPGSGQATP